MVDAPFSVGMIFWRVNYLGLITTHNIIECHEAFVTQHLCLKIYFLVKNNLTPIQLWHNRARCSKSQKSQCLSFSMLQFSVSHLNISESRCLSFWESVSQSLCISESWCLRLSQFNSVFVSQSLRIFRLHIAFQHIVPMVNYHSKWVIGEIP